MGRVVNRAFRGLEVAVAVAGVDGEEQAVLPDLAFELAMGHRWNPWNCEKRRRVEIGGIFQAVAL